MYQYYFLSNWPTLVLSSTPLLNLFQFSLFILLMWCVSLMENCLFVVVVAVGFVTDVMANWFPLRIWPIFSIEDEHSLDVWFVQFIVLFPKRKQLAKACFRHSNTFAQYFPGCEEHKTMSIFHSPFFMWLWIHFVFIALLYDVHEQIAAASTVFDAGTVKRNHFTKKNEVNVGNAIFRYSPLWYEYYSTTMSHSQSNWTVAYSGMLTFIANGKTLI